MSVKKLRLKLNVILEYLIALFLIIGANSVYSRLANINIHVNIITIILLFIYVLNKVIIKYKVKSTLINIKRILKKYFGFFSAFLILLLVFIIVNNTINLNFISLYLIMLPLFILIYVESRESIFIIMKNFVLITAVLSALSLLLYILIDVLHIFDYSNYVTISWGGLKKIESFYYMYFKTQDFHFHNYIFIRNTGIFSEAPMYSLILTLSVCFNELFLNSNKLIRYLLILTMITTFSTIGYISVLLIYALLLFFKSKINKRILFIIILLPLILCWFLFFNRLKSLSGSTRIDDYIASYNTWIDNNILVGVGFGNEKAIYDNMSSFRDNNKGLSNSFMVVLAEGGLYLFLIYFIPFIFTSVRYIKEKNWNYIIFNIIILFLFLTVIFFYTNVMISILALGYVSIISNKKKIQKKY